MYTMTFLRVLAILALQLTLVAAQTLPFSITDLLTGASPDSGTAINRGGTVTIGGFTVKIPENLLVEFPARFVPFAEFCAGDRAGPSNEVSISGNIVNGQIIAGQMSISQVDLAFASGVIEALDVDGAIKIANGPTIRINDPNGVYSKNYTGLPFYTADDENPSITSFSGFPVCVPRSATDPQCPSSNRPAAGTGIIPDALHMAPLRVGDYVEYSGVRFNGETLVYGLVANIDIRTSGSQPGYVRVEDAIIGISDTGADVEAARHRFIGLASRSDLIVSIFAVDEDPCTGKETERLITSVQPIASNRNKWTVDVPRNSDIGKYTRQYVIRIGDTVVKTTDGIDAGKYYQPVSEWIFPELTTPGGAPPPNNFANIGPLVNGFGPIDGTIFGPLRPWPGATTPAPSVTNCPPPTTQPEEPEPEDPSTPVTVSARAGIDQTILGGTFVSLSAKNDTGTGAGLTFNWTQIAGPTVTLSSKTEPDVSFSAPTVAANAANVQREFLVVITHTASGTKNNDTVVVTSVARGKSVYDHPVIDSLTWASKQSGTATALVHTDLVDASASMRIIFNSDNTERAMTKVTTSNGKTSYSFNSRDVKKYTSATIRSYLNNVAVGGPVVSSTNVQTAA